MPASVQVHLGACVCVLPRRQADCIGGISDQPAWAAGGPVSALGSFARLLLTQVLGRMGPALALTQIKYSEISVVPAAVKHLEGEDERRKTPAAGKTSTFYDTSKAALTLSIDENWSFCSSVFRKTSKESFYPLSLARPPRYTWLLFTLLGLAFKFVYMASRKGFDAEFCWEK